MFIACGLNHKTAPLPIREKFACDPEKQHKILNRLIDSATAHEAALLSTCNRTEFYCDMDDPNSLLPWLSDEYKICTNELRPYLYIHPDQHGIRHTLRVASGLDSMMLGEPQILGQMKQAYQNALNGGTIKKNLQNTFEYIFSASKRIRSRSGIGNNPVSVAYAAVRLIGQMFNDFSKLNVFLIGSGETSSLVAKYLQKEGVKQFLIASRTLTNAEKLAAQFEGQALSISDIPQFLPQADVVISATACPLPFINPNLVSHALEQRNHQPMFFLDLAVPRDIEPEVAELDQVQLYNVDDLEHIIQQGMNERKNAALEAEELINAELDQYIRWHRSLRANDVICDYRSQMQILARFELQRSMAKLTRGHNSEQVMQELCDRLMNKLLHQPSAGLREAAWDGREDLLELARYIYNPNQGRNALFSYLNNKDETIT